MPCHSLTVPDRRASGGNLWPSIMPTRGLLPPKPSPRKVMNDLEANLGGLQFKFLFEKPRVTSLQNPLSTSFRSDFTSLYFEVFLTLYLSPCTVEILSLTWRRQCKAFGMLIILASSDEWSVRKGVLRLRPDCRSEASKCQTALHFTSGFVARKNPDSRSTIFRTSLSAPRASLKEGDRRSPAINFALESRWSRGHSLYLNNFPARTKKNATQ